MKPIKTPILLQDFTILNSSFAFTPYQGKKSIGDLFDSYELDMNYRFEAKGELLYLYAKVSINKPISPLPGYSVFAEGVCIFSFEEKSKLTSEQKVKYANYSGIPIAFNCLRGFIMDLTASGPLGRYVLPVFDVKDLMTKKFALMRTANTPRKARRRAVTPK